VASIIAPNDPGPITKPMYMPRATMPDAPADGLDGDEAQHRHHARLRFLVCGCDDVIGEE
jgi:hypothetical protein